MGSASLNRLGFGGLAFQKKRLRELAMYANLESAEILEPGAVRSIGLRFAPKLQLVEVLSGVGFCQV
jgi:hypothetical protein